MIVFNDKEKGRDSASKSIERSRKRHRDTRIAGLDEEVALFSETVANSESEKNAFRSKHLYFDREWF